MTLSAALALASVPVIALTALRTRSVTRGGALAGLAVGLAIAYGAGWGGVAMLAVLLVGGTLVSRRGARSRDALQVVSNGGVAALGALLLAARRPRGAWILAGALAAAFSDTVAGELGRRSPRAPRMLLFGSRVPRGTDGGMTLPGTLAGMLAAPAVPFVGLAFGLLPDAAAAGRVACAGFVGNLADSALGWLLQPRLGRRGNDWTNVLATIVGAAAALLLA